MEKTGKQEENLLFYLDENFMEKSSLFIQGVGKQQKKKVTCSFWGFACFGNSFFD